jgi:hypothetical protein
MGGNRLQRMTETVDLGVVGIEMWTQTMPFDYTDQVCRVQQEQNGAED